MQHNTETTQRNRPRRPQIVPSARARESHEHPHHGLPWTGVCGLQGRCKSFATSSNYQLRLRGRRGTNTKKKKGEFKAKGIESNTPFAAIDLSEGEWYDYDDKASEEVSIKDIKWEIRRA